MGGIAGEDARCPCSSFPVALGFVHIDRQPDGRALFARNHRPVAFLPPPPRPRLGAEVTAHQEQYDGERDDAKEPKSLVADAEHSQSINWCCGKSCTFKPV